MKGTVVIVGLGLIGGSIGLAIKKEHPQSHIIGIDISLATLEKGKALGVIDEIGESLQVDGPKADLLIFGSPVGQTESLLERLPMIDLKADVIITDTGSTKTAIVKAASNLLAAGKTFIGGHPMAGSHKSGVTAAKPLLFENAYYLLTPPKQIAQEKIRLLRKWLVGTNAKFMEITPEEHDKITGMLSHLPHIVAAALVNQTSDFTNDHPAAFRLAAGGFRDITRVASSDPRMWTEISLSNREILKKQLMIWKKGMEDAIQMIDQQEEATIYSFFDNAKEFRDSLPIHEGGAIPAFYDLFVDVPDYPGVISEVTGLLAEEAISLTNIKILETREDIFGVLQITFQTSDDRENAKKCIESKSGYACHYGEEE